MDSKMLLTCALDIGEKMLISGAEISRVEDSHRVYAHLFRQVRARP